MTAEDDAYDELKREVSAMRDTRSDLNEKLKHAQNRLKIIDHKILYFEAVLRQKDTLIIPATEGGRF